MSILKQHDSDPQILRGLLVDNIKTFFTIYGLGVVDDRVIGAFQRIPRHKYVPSEHIEDAYDSNLIPVLNVPQVANYVESELKKRNISEDSLSSLPDNEAGLLVETLAAPIASTASQPSLVAAMIEYGLPSPEDQRQLPALEIGAGCGYATALLSETGAYSQVYGIEINRDVAALGKHNLKNNNQKGVEMVHADGVEWLKRNGERCGPFSTILVSASVRDPDAITLMSHYLADGAKLVAPVVTNSYAKPIVIPSLPDLQLTEQVDSTMLRLYELHGTELAMFDILPKVKFVDLKG